MADKQKMLSDEAEHSELDEDGLVIGTPEQKQRDEADFQEALREWNEAVAGYLATEIEELVQKITDKLG